MIFIKGRDFEIRLDQKFRDILRRILEYMVKE